MYLKRYFSVMAHENLNVLSLSLQDLFNLRLEFKDYFIEIEKRTP